MRPWASPARPSYWTASAAPNWSLSSAVSGSSGLSRVNCWLPELVSPPAAPVEHVDRPGIADGADVLGGDPHGQVGEAVVVEVGPHAGGSHRRCPSGRPAPDRGRPTRPWPPA